MDAERFKIHERRRQRIERVGFLPELTDRDTHGNSMNLVVTCKCGNKFHVQLGRDDEEFVCPGCGKISTLNGPKAQEEAFVTPDEYDNVRLLDLPVSPSSIDEYDDV